MWHHWFILYNSFVLMIHQILKKHCSASLGSPLVEKKTGKNRFLKWIIHNIYVYISYVYFYIFDIDSNSLDLNDSIMYIPTSITPYLLLKCEFLSVGNFLQRCGSSHFWHECDIFITTGEEKMSSKGFPHISDDWETGDYINIYISKWMSALL